MTDIDQTLKEVATRLEGSPTLNELTDDLMAMNRILIGDFTEDQFFKVNDLSQQIMARMAALAVEALES